MFRINATLTRLIACLAIILVSASVSARIDAKNQKVRVKRFQ